MQPVSATPELTLPGLETPEVVTHTQPGHWIERGPQKRLMVFSGRSHKSLAERIGRDVLRYHRSGSDPCSVPDL